MKILITTVGLVLTFSVSTYCQNKTYSLQEYFDDPNVHINDLIKVSSSLDTLTLHGYRLNDAKNLYTVKVKLNKGEVLASSKWSYFGNLWHWSPLPISITTIPFKIRPGIEDFNTKATSGLTNIGLNIDVFRWKTERFFSNANKSTHKFNMGIWIAPSVEELDSIETMGFLENGNKSKQLFMSTALTINYTYNNITFTFTPLGFDIGTNSVGKSWIYDKRRWWGFGIGLEPKFLNTVLNK